jgi:hypothetical protein
MIDKLIIASKLLGDFNNFIDKRSAIFSTWSDKMIDSVMQWHFDVWKKEHQSLGRENKLDEWSMYRDLSRTLDSIFRKIEIRALKERSSFTFFKKLEGHAEKYKKESVSSRSYDESLFDTFYQIFFENIYDAPERFSIWNHFFPGEWKITKGNIQSSENIISKISLQKFFTWASNRIWHPNKEIDFALNEVSSNLFPEVDPILWAKILIFIFSPYGEDRLASVIERPWNFGLMGRVRVYRGGEEDKIKRIQKDEEINTFELSYLLFEEQFSKINLENYIKSLERLSYQKESEEESKKLRLYSLFTRMFDFGQREIWKDADSSKDK